jgi:GTPase
VFTKTDLVTKFELEEVLLKFKSLLRFLRIKRSPIVVENNEDIILLNRNLEENIIPTFFVSNTTGEGLDLLFGFLSNLPVRSKEEVLKQACKEKLQFDVHEALEVSKKVILAGIVVNGRLTADKYFLGPNQKGDFK